MCAAEFRQFLPISYHNIRFALDSQRTTTSQNSSFYYLKTENPRHLWYFSIEPVSIWFRLLFRLSNASGWCFPTCCGFLNRRRRFMQFYRSWWFSSTFHAVRLFQCIAAVDKYRYVIHIWVSAHLKMDLKQCNFYIAKEKKINFEPIKMDVCTFDSNFFVWSIVPSFYHSECTRNRMHSLFVCFTYSMNRPWECIFVLNSSI